MVGIRARASQAPIAMIGVLAIYIKVGVTFGRFVRRYSVSLFTLGLVIVFCNLYVLSV